MQTEGWWYWPGDRLYDDWNGILAYHGRPARKADSWHAAALANAEIDLTMQRPGRVAHWPMDEGRGETVADTSQKVVYPGVLVAGAESLHGLTQFTLSAWVRLDAMSAPRNGATLIDKGPEAPVQHFWWWIGYPPDYRLILELGNEKHPYGRSAHSAALK